MWNVPNILTFSRLFATPLIGYLIVHDHHLWAFSLFVYAGFSDLRDGWIARRWKLQTVVGSVIDPMADKFLMTTLVSCLAINGSLSLPLATLILGRDVSLAIAAIYFRYASLPAPKTFARYWDFRLTACTNYSFLRHLPWTGNSYGLVQWWCPICRETSCSCRGRKYIS